VPSGMGGSERAPEPLYVGSRSYWVCNTSPVSDSGPGPDLSGQNLVFSDVPSQTRVANHFAVASSVHGVPHLHGSMRLVEPHRTI
jgi:hypothetical protein